MLEPTGGAGGTGERVVREPRVPQEPATRSERSERRERRGGCGERATPSPGQDPHLRYAQISRERKLQIARARIAAIQATAQITYAAGGGSAAKNGFAATAGPSCD